VAVFKTFSVPGTKQPNKIPRTIARKIHRARKRSRKESLLIRDAECCDAVLGEGSPSAVGASSGKRFVECACMATKLILFARPPPTMQRKTKKNNKKIIRIPMQVTACFSLAHFRVTCRNGRRTYQSKSVSDQLINHDAWRSPRATAQPLTDNR